MLCGFSFSLLLFLGEKIKLLFVHDYTTFDKWYYCFMCESRCYVRIVVCKRIYSKF